MRHLIGWPLLPPLLPDVLVLLGRHQVPLPVRRGIHLAATLGLVRAASLLPFAVFAQTGPCCHCGCRGPVAPPWR